jgi:membrane associated rhomboid family serine protease
MKVPRFHRLDVALVLALNVAVYVYERTLSSLEEMVFSFRFGAVPASMWEAWHAFREQGMSREILGAAIPLITANYLHAGLMHIAGNMLFFWIFGTVVSQVTGRALFLLLYTLSGIVAVLVYVKTNPASEVPMVGASGAIAGLEGAYFVLAYRWEMPHAHVWPLDGPVAPWRLAVVALINFAMDTQAFFGHSRDTTAYGAHVGGFLGGAMTAMVIASVWRPKWRREA